MGEDFGLAASTAWEYYQLITGLLADLLGTDVDELCESVHGKICLVDGMLVTVFNWRHRSDLFSGKHRRYGMNVQVIADVHGRVLGSAPAFRAAGMICAASLRRGWVPSPRPRAPRWVMRAIRAAT